MVLSLVLDGVVDGVFCCTDGGLDHPSLGGSCTSQAPPPVLILTETFLRYRPLSGAKAILLHC